MKISQLPEATPLDQNDLLVVVQDGVTKKITVENLENSLMTTPLTTLIDEVSTSVTYIGKAAPGSATSSAVWRIQRLTTTGPDLAVEYAAGGAFSQAWDNRASLSYS